MLRSNHMHIDTVCLALIGVIFIFFSYIMTMIMIKYNDYYATYMKSETEIATMNDKINNAIITMNLLFIVIWSILMVYWFTGLDFCISKHII
jgi:hypothetical protein